MPSLRSSRKEGVFSKRGPFGALCPFLLQERNGPLLRHGPGVVVSLGVVHPRSRDEGLLRLGLHALGNHRTSLMTAFSTMDCSRARCFSFVRICLVSERSILMMSTVRLDRWFRLLSPTPKSSSAIWMPACRSRFSVCAGWSTAWMRMLSVISRVIRWGPRRTCGSGAADAPRCSPPAAAGRTG